MRLLAHAQQPQQVGDKSQARQGKQSCFAENGGAVSPYIPQPSRRSVWRRGTVMGSVMGSSRWTQLGSLSCSVATLLAARREMGGQGWVSTSHPHGLVLLCAVGMVWCGAVWCGVVWCGVSGFGAFPWFVMLFCLFCFFSFCSPLDVHSLTTQTGGQALWLKVEAIPAGGHPASYFSSTAALLGAYCLARPESWW